MLLQHNVPIAKIIPLPQKIKRKLGSATGLFTMSDDFNNPLSGVPETPVLANARTGLSQPTGYSTTR